VRHWVTGAQFLDLFAISRFIPGPSSILGALIGFNIAGLLGALAWKRKLHPFILLAGGAIAFELAWLVR